MNYHYFIKDAVYGATDGIVTTFAVIAGVTGAQLEIRVLLIIGFASLLADAFSMAASNYLGSKSKAEVMSNDGVNPRKTEAHPLAAAGVTFGSFLLLGSLPLIIYILFISTPAVFLITSGFTLAILFLTGAMRTLVTKRFWCWGGIEMMLIGGAAAAIAWMVGGLVNLWT